MMELLKNLQSESLLTPLATILTALIALSAVLINNLSIWLITRYQLNRNSKESDRKNKLDIKISALQEKREKLEVLHENLQHFLEISNDCITRTDYSIYDSNLNVHELELALNKVLDDNFKAQRYRRKVEVLGSSYSDHLTHEFNQLNEHAAAIKDSISFLSTMCIVAQAIGKNEAEYEKSRDAANKRCNGEYQLMKELTDKIEEVVIREIRESREDIMLLKNKNI